MLTLLGKRHDRNYCDGMSRRDFVRVGSLGLAGVGLPDLLRARADTAAARPSRNTSVVLLWLDGGATHIETFDPKPEAPVEFRSLTGQVQTRVPGLCLGGLFPKMANVADKMAIVHSFASGADESHPGGSHAIKTGYPFPRGVQPSFETQVRPSIGSILSRVRGASHPRTGVPTYVDTELGNGRRFGVHHAGAVFLGKEHGPFRAEQKDALKDMSLNVPPAVLHDRRELLKAFDEFDRTLDQSGSMRSLDALQQRAFHTLGAGRVKEAFDLTREDGKTRERYGRGLGERLLLARRLCEAGTGFVSIYYGDWDMHSNFGPMTESLKRACPPLDHAVSVFVEDIYERGLDQDILLVITGEMGRTPRINGLGGRSFGRDHWPNLCTLALAGGGLKMGQVIGESTARAEMPKSRPVSPQDLMATLFRHLEIDPQVQFKDLAGRPVSMIEDGKPIEELF